MDLHQQGYSGSSQPTSIREHEPSNNCSFLSLRRLFARRSSAAACKKSQVPSLTVAVSNAPKWLKSTQAEESTFRVPLCRSMRGHKRPGALARDMGSANGRFGRSLADP
jgi:hypothetical protein